MDDLYQALKNADAAGDVESAKKIAAYIQSQQPQKTSLAQDAGNLLAGAVRGAGSIGATILTPYDLAVGNTKSWGNPERRQAIDSGLQQLGAQTDSGLYKTGKIGAEIAGTAGAGGLLGNAVGKVAPALGEAITSGGFSLGENAGSNALANALTRIGGGSINGGVSAGMVNPEESGTGLIIGGAMPASVKGTASAAEALANSLKVAPKFVSPEVRALAEKAKTLGIDVPVDRLLDSKPLNALAASLNYVPLSGRAATESNMAYQLNKALSKTFGQDTTNITKGLRDAADTLGQKFDDVLKNNNLKIDDQFVTDLANIESTAKKELGADALRPIQSQIDEILAKTQNGEIDGQAAYNIKKTLDRLGRGNGNEAYHANEMKKSLMEALNRSLGADKAAEFATVRKQYGNMLALENIAKNGAEGDISVARLANMKNINNGDLQELADIAAQFVKPREGMHGAAQRVGLGLGAGIAGGATGTLPLVGASMGGARLANALLNSDTARNILLNPSSKNKALANMLKNPALIAAPSVVAAD